MSLIVLSRSLKQALVALTVLVTVGCAPGGSDVEPEGSGGGIGGSGMLGYTVGTLTAFGSVFINGERFDTAGAEFLINGQAASQDQLRVGMQLSARVDFSVDSASRVNYVSNLIGAVETSPNAAGTFTVLNQTVVLSNKTVLDSLSIQTLIPGTRVEISGSSDAANRLIATYVRPAVENQLLLSGSITAVNPGERQLLIGSMSVNFDQAELRDIALESLTAGVPVIVTAEPDQYDQQTATLIASSLRRLDTFVPQESQRIELSGFVRGIVSDSVFTIDDFTVETNQNTVFVSVDGSTLSSSAVDTDALIEIEGSFTGTGSVLAERVIVIPDDNTELTGPIESIDSNAASLQILGVTVNTTDLTRYGGSDDSGRINFTTLRIGDTVEIDATYTGSRLIASKIEVDEPEGEATLEGPVTRVNAELGLLEIVGVPISFDGDTEFEAEEIDEVDEVDEIDEVDEVDEIDEVDFDQEIDQLSFLRQLSVGAIVKATWEPFFSVLDPVDELELD